MWRFFRSKSKPALKLEEKIPCIDCGTMILPQTAQDTDGYCRPCFNRGAEGRAASKAYAASVADGSVFSPLPLEIEGERHPLDFVKTAVAWQIYQDPCETEPPLSINSALEALAESKQAALYLGFDETHHLILEVTELYGVCTLMSGAENDDYTYLYSHGPDNVDEQGCAEMQVTAGCPCCGVGMWTHASRVHMPRDEAIKVFQAAVQHDYSKTKWYHYEIDSYCSEGYG